MTYSCNMNCALVMVNAVFCCSWHLVLLANGTNLVKERLIKKYYTNQTKLDIIKSSPVVDVAMWADIPALDSIPHLLHHIVSLWFTHWPNLWPVKHDVWKHATCIIWYFNPICLAIQKVAVKTKKIERSKWKIKQTSALEWTSEWSKMRWRQKKLKIYVLITVTVLGWVF